MSSPLHKFLFSPPPSPPIAAGAADPNEPFTPLRTLKAVAANTADTFKLAVPQQNSRRSQSPTRDAMNVDVEAANAYEKPKSSAPMLTRLFSPRIRLLQARYIPRPLVRLTAFMLVLFAAALFVSHVVLPTVFPLQTSSAAPVVVAPPVLAEAAAVPTKVQEEAPQVVYTPLVAPNPRSFRPDPHPLPETHELLAIQSFILESPANELPTYLDASVPVDAARIIGTRAASRLRGQGSPQEQEWLKELTTEASTKVVLWFSSAAPPHYALEGIISRHGHGRRPELISISKRNDGAIVRDILKRLGHNVNEVPVLVIGGEVFDASVERMDELRSSGQLAQKLAQIGWR